MVRIVLHHFSMGFAKYQPVGTKPWNAERVHNYTMICKKNMSLYLIYIYIYIITMTTCLSIRTYLTKGNLWGELHTLGWSGSSFSVSRYTHLFWLTSRLCYSSTEMSKLSWNSIPEVDKIRGTWFLHLAWIISSRTTRACCVISTLQI